jgi:hypothetical protein
MTVTYTGAQVLLVGQRFPTSGYLVSQLSSLATLAGSIVYILDGDAGLAWGATAVNSGGGATKYLIWYNGTNWTVVGK